MSFLGGALVGCVVGLAAGALLARRRSGPGPGDPARAEPHRPARGRSDLGAAAIVIAALALAASGVALARSNDRPAATGAAASNTAPPTTAAAATTAPGPTTTTTSAAALEATVAVPNVVSQARATAEAMLKNAGLKVSVETLSLSNVPSGFVISQTPLPAALVTVGSTVSLVVSAAT